MPSSIVDHVPAVIRAVQGADPKRVIDVGVGFGKWGHLVREYLDIWGGRLTPEEWLVDIVGIEVFPGYINPATEYFYDVIHHGDACEVMQRIAPADVVLAIDVIEHQDTTDGLALAWQCISKARKLAILSIPLGEEWLKANASYVKRNPWEEHKSAWRESQILELPGCITMDTFPGPRGDVGLFIFKGAHANE